MRRLTFAVAIALLITPAAAADLPLLYVAGDSIGVGIAQAAHLPSVAKVGAPMAIAAGQLQRVPDGATVIVSVGTNDAVAGRTSGALQTYKAIASARHLRLIWVGPPCILRPWDKAAAAFSTWLAGRTEHVALRDPAFCSSKVRANDGVHFTGRGYAMLWAKIRRAIGGNA